MIHGNHDISMDKNIIIIIIWNNIKDIKKDIKLTKNCKEKNFPDRPEEAAMFGCESLSTEIF